MEAVMNRIPLIIDTDPGVDDTIALIMSMAWEGFDIRGITAVGGNVDLSYTAQNAKNIVGLCGRSIAVAQGAKGPLYKSLITASHIHGINGMGSLVLPQIDIPYDSALAVDRIYQEAIACGKTLRLLTLGPMTNVAAAILKYPELPKHIHSIVAMGGSMGKGNVTELAEFNIYADPDSAQIVIDSGIEITFVGLDVTVPTVIRAEDNEVIRQVGNKVADVVSSLNDYTIARYHPGESEGAMMHDPLAASVLMNPDVIKTAHRYMSVDCTDGPTRGQTKVDMKCELGKAPNVYIAIEADPDLFMKLLLQLVKRY